MHILSTYLPPSATSHAIKCNVGEELLVVSRLNRLDVYELLSDGAKPLTSTEIPPRIVALEEISLDGGPSALLVITDYPDCSALILEFSRETRVFAVKSSQRLVSPYGLPLVGCNTCAVSADGRFAAVAHYEGIINVLSFSRNKKDKSIVISSKFEAPIRELLLLNFCLVPSQDDEDLKIAMLCRTYDRRQEIVIRTIDLEEKEISSSSSTIDLGGSDATTIVPIKIPQNGFGGLLLLGDDEIKLYDGFTTSSPISPTKRRQSTSSSKHPLVKAEWPYAKIKGHGFIDGSRLLLSDQYGKLVLLSLTKGSDDRKIRQLNLHLLGESSAARCIVYLNAGVIFTGSETGDSHLLQLNSSGSFNIVDTFDNVAPIGDAILADLDNSGKPAIVTCSGEGHTGSLRIIKSGATIEQIASFDGVQGVQKTFSITSGTSKYSSYLLLSFHDETKIINAISLSQVTEVSLSEFPGIIRNQPTLAAGNVSRLDGEPCTLAVQVTPIAVVLVDMQTGTEVARWESSIVLASINATALAISIVSKEEIISLIVDAEKGAFTQVAKKKIDSEISALTLRQLHPKDPRTLVFIGYWSKYVVSICRFETLNPLAGADTIEVPHVPRSIMVWQFGSGSSDYLSLMVGTGNGQLVTLKLDSNSNTVDLSSRRTMSLGDRPVSLQECYSEGKRAILATGGRTVLITEKNGRVLQDTVNVKGLENTILFNHSSYPKSMLLNLSTGLTVARIKKLEKLKIETVSLGYDIPHTLAYHQDVNAFAIGTVRREPSRPGAPDLVTSSFKLYDALTYEQLYSYPMGLNEEVTKVSVESLSVNGKLATFVVVGTAIWEEDADEPSKGRILLFKAQNRPPQPATANATAPTLTLVLDQEISGAAMDLGGLEGSLAVIVNTILIVYEATRNENTKAMKLRPIDQWVHSYALSSLFVVGTQVVVGDSLQSVTVLDREGTKLRFIAKDWSSMNSMNISADDDYIIQSDIDSNLTSYEIDATDKLQQRGNIFFSENISRIIPGSLDSEGRDNTLPAPSHLLFTPGGRVTIISKCNEDKAMQLQKIQNNLSAALEDNHWDMLAWRAPHMRVRTEEPPQATGFIDGDFLNSYLDLEPNSKLAAAVLKGKNAAERLDLTDAQLRQLIEELMAVH